MSKHKENINILVLIISLFVIGIAFYFLQTNVFKSEKDIKDLSQKILNAKSKNIELDLIKNNLKSTLDNYTFLKNIFLTEEGVVDFLQEIEDLGEISGVNLEVTSVSNRGFKDNKKTELLVIGLKFSGNYIDSMQFLSLLENLPRKVSIERLDMKFEELENTETKKVSRIWNTSIVFSIIKEVNK